MGAAGGDRNAKGDRHRCQSPCHRTSALDPCGPHGLVSAACSIRAGKGMRISRRSPGPVVARCQSSALPPAVGGPLRAPSRRTSSEPCGMRSRSMLQPCRRLRDARVDAPFFVLSFRLLCLRLRAGLSGFGSSHPPDPSGFRCACAPLPLSGSVVLRLSLETSTGLTPRIRFATCRCCIPRPGRSWFPEGTCPSLVR
jgi:hypothetical protein